MKRILQALTALTVSALLSACGGGGSGDGPTTGSTSSADLADTTKSTSGTSMMTSAMDASGLTPTMKGSQELTLLAPSDEALAEYAEDLAELKKPENAAALQDFVKAHIVDGTVLAAKLEEAGKAAAAVRDGSKSAAAATITITIKNLLGDELEIEFENGVLTINGAESLTLDIRARNGVLHLFKGCLFRPTVFSIVKRLPQTSTLEAAIVAADLKDTLKGKGPFTLFAPTNAAFDSLLKELNLTADQLLANKPLLTQVLTYHVLAARVLARQIEDGATPTTVEGQFITLNATGKGKARAIKITDARGRVANVVLANLQARNGVVHLIDKVILPTDKDIVDIAAGNPNFSILVEAVQAAGLVDTLKGKGPFTVFAPTNEAFAALLTELNVSKAALLADKALLTKVLTYHVLASRVLANDITDGLAAATVEGQPIKLRKAADGKVSIIDASGRTSNVILTNVQAKNGVIHAIDKVILPTAKNIVQVAQSNPDFSILVEAVVAANLAGTLSGAGPFTVFAPTNEAFAKLLAELNITKAALLADKTLLAKVLTYHVVPGQVLSSGIPFGMPITTVQGQTFTISKSLKITDQNGRMSTIIATDVAATNGVIHVIDTVILPK